MKNENGIEKSAILKGSTKYRDIDTGEFLETFEEGRNLELVSVKMPVLCTIGKNLFNSNNTMDGYGFNVGEVVVKDTLFISDYIEVKPNLSYIISASDNSVVGRRVNFYDKDKNFVETGRYENLIITVPNNNKIFYMRTNADLSIKSSYQIEQGTVATSYEPYKTNILTVNEEVELRGIGDVQDTLDLTTGELTERISTFKPTGAWSTSRVSKLSSIKPNNRSIPTRNRVC